MVKKITLTMQSSKDIDIMVNDVVVFTIPKDKRSVNAETVYLSLGYARGDKYEIQSVNAENKDVHVLQFFVELYEDICNKLNTISSDGQQEQVGSEGTMVETKEIPDEYPAEHDELPF